MFICHREQLTGQVLDHQTGYKILGSIFFRKNQEDGAFLFDEQLRIDAPIEADNLFQLRVQKCVQLGKHSRHDGIHALIRCRQRRSCQPFGFVVGRDQAHQLLKLVATSPGGTLHQKLLHQLKY